eukprot:4057117-Amphidinium_carterae.1
MNILDVQVFSMRATIWRCGKLAALQSDEKRCGWWLQGWRTKPDNFVAIQANLSSSSQAWPQRPEQTQRRAHLLQRSFSVEQNAILRHILTTLLTLSNELHKKSTTNTKKPSTIQSTTATR